MTTTIKVLGQSAPAATTETDLYTAPNPAVISSIVIANRGSAATTFRISISIAGGATANKDYIYYDLVLAGNDTFISTVGFTLAATDKVRVFAGNNQLSFSIFGEEIS